MAQERLIKVCVIEDSNGKVLFVGKVKQVNQMELNNLINKANATRQEYAQKYQEIVSELDTLKEEIRMIKGE